MPDDLDHRRGILRVTCAAVAWSLADFFTRLIALDAWTILFWRGIFGGFFIAIYVMWRHGPQTLAATRAMGWPGVFVTCLSTLGMTTFIPALKLTTVASVAIILATCPFVAAAVAWTWHRERISALTTGARLLAFAGVPFAVGDANLVAGSCAGDGLAFVMTRAIAAMTVAMRRFKDVPLLPTACLSNLLGALVSVPRADPLATSGREFAYLALFGFAQMSLGLTLFTIGSRLIPAAVTALIGALETPLAPLWVWIAFGEKVAPRTLAGGTVVMVAVVGHALLQARTRRSPRPANGT